MIETQAPGSSTTRLERDNPALTVVIPVHNGGAYIEETLSSVEHQTVSSIEVIVVDDGSTDNSIDRIRRHPLRPTVVEQAHLGVAVARNHGLAMARGRWVAFLDQDDLWHPTHAETALEWLAGHPEQCVLVLGETAFSVAEEARELAEQDESVAEWGKLRVPRDASLSTLMEAAPPSGSGALRFHSVRDLLSGPISVTTSFVADAHLLRLAGGFAPHAPAMDDYWLLVNAARLAPNLANLVFPPEGRPRERRRAMVRARLPWLARWVRQIRRAALRRFGEPA